MWEYIEKRARTNAEYIADTGCTVRACSAHFNVSKSTVHKDVTERIKFIDRELWERVQTVLGCNLKERHLRGGSATRRKYEKMRSGAEK